ncbi:hypothetical protein [Paraglaciecola sp. 20A4]|uniref:hypothetical protein n=1 Tax=Paraglaciecola sp. 20A4 TaxID=2687288 RepID=UPI00140C4A1A|nr:hypothetical protein [Paraglaciecola sp. 20A4]
MNLLTLASSYFVYEVRVSKKMRASIKAALLTGLVYPGAGHLYLKKSAIGISFLCAFSVPLYLIISEIMTKTMGIVEQIGNGEIPLDVTAISASLSSVTAMNPHELNIKIYALITIWLIAIVDSFRIGNKAAQR